MISISGEHVDSILDKTGYKAIVFTTENCSACEDLIQYLDKLQTITNEVSFFKTDIDIDLKNKYSISHAPTTIIFNNGRIVDVVTGFKKDVKYYLKCVIFP